MYKVSHHGGWEIPLFGLTARNEKQVWRRLHSHHQGNSLDDTQFRLSWISLDRRMLYIALLYEVKPVVLLHNYCSCHLWNASETNDQTDYYCSNRSPQLTDYSKHGTQSNNNPYMNHTVRLQISWYKKFRRKCMEMPQIQNFTRETENKQLNPPHHSTVGISLLF